MKKIILIIICILQTNCMFKNASKTLSNIYKTNAKSPLLLQKPQKSFFSKRFNQEDMIEYHEVKGHLGAMLKKNSPLAPFAVTTKYYKFVLPVTKAQFSTPNFLKTLKTLHENTEKKSQEIAMKKNNLKTADLNKLYNEYSNLKHQKALVAMPLAHIMSAGDAGSNYYLKTLQDKNIFIPQDKVNKINEQGLRSDKAFFLDILNEHMGINEKKDVDEIWNTERERHFDYILNNKEKLQELMKKFKLSKHKTLTYNDVNDFDEEPLDKDTRNILDEKAEMLKSPAGFENFLKKEVGERSGDVFPHVLEHNINQERKRLLPIHEHLRDKSEWKGWKERISNYFK